MTRMRKVAAVFAWVMVVLAVWVVAAELYFYLAKDSSKARVAATEALTKKLADVAIDPGRLVGPELEREGDRSFDFVWRCNSDAKVIAAHATVYYLPYDVKVVLLGISNDADRQIATSWTQYFPACPP